MSATTHPMKTREPVSMEPALKFIEENCVRNPKLARIAKTVHLSPFHFHRVFHAATGRTPKQMITDRRMARAKALLRGSQPIASISTLLGFAHQSHFTSVFRMEVGMTPAKFRKAPIELEPTTA